MFCFFAFFLQKEKRRKERHRLHCRFPATTRSAAQEAFPRSSAAVVRRPPADEGPGHRQVSLSALPSPCQCSGRQAGKVSVRWSFRGLATSFPKENVKTAVTGVSRKPALGTAGDKCLWNRNKRPRARSCSQRPRSDMQIRCMQGGGLINLSLAFARTSNPTSDHCHPCCFVLADSQDIQGK